MTTTENMPCDTGAYERSCYQRRALIDADNLYEAFKKSCTGKMWKPSVQRYANEWLIHLSRLQKELAAGRYQLKGVKRFVLTERGKPRVIDAEHIEDRVVQHLICDKILLPEIVPTLIYDNSASLPGKGVDFCRRRIVTHLSRYYRQYGNQGYVLIMDFSRYYDNLDHGVIKEQMQLRTENPMVLSLIGQVLKRSRPDVSYMGPDELNGVFDSLKHTQVPDTLKTGERYLDKSLAAGSQMAQTIGISYPYLIDNYVKIVKGCRYYARYMDDSYVIHPDKEFLKTLRNEIMQYCDSLGIWLNPRKIRMCPLPKGFRFLQIKYTLTDTGKIHKRINPKKLAVRRRTMKRTARHMEPVEFIDWSKAWYRAFKRYMSGPQKKAYKKLTFELLEETNGYTHSDRRYYDSRFNT